VVPEVLGAPSYNTSLCHLQGGFCVQHLAYLQVTLLLQREVLRFIFM
jgi:hypothetical protein